MSTTSSISPHDWLNILFRLSLALFVGGTIGFNRQIKHKPAGLRTHMLVSFGAALFVMVPLQITSPQDTADAASRAIQGVATGIGFLGAGEILRESQDSVGKVKVRGLTSAAAIWVSAGLGIAVGCGLWQMGLIAALLSLFTLSGVKKLEAFMKKEPDQ